MQKFILLLVIVLSANFSYGQESFSQRIKEIAKEIINVKSDEKEMLSEEIDEINEKIDEKEITAEEGEKLKSEAAEKSAARMEERISALEKELSDLIKEKVESNDSEAEGDDKVYDEETGELKLKIKPGKSKKVKGEPRTTSQAVFALGLNTLIEDKDFGTLDNGKFRLSNSRFYEFGATYKTRIFANSNLLHIKYGISLRVNNVRPDENQYFIKNGESTSLMVDTRDYSKDAYFRTAQWVAPIYFEFDFTKPKRTDDGVKFKTQKSFRFGVGGFVGVNSRSRQVLHYTNDKIKYEENAKGNFNVNNFVYGLGAYIGYRDISLYGKYDMNELFGGESIAYNNVSMGVRWDFN
ncbi:MAG: hypothetical protein IPL63_17920 [Saprospiraceae bacterium]|nr:hypothetical protein [Saprospiraceae bacterium]